MKRERERDEERERERDEESVAEEKAGLRRGTSKFQLWVRCDALQCISLCPDVCLEHL